MADAANRRVVLEPEAQWATAPEEPRSLPPLRRRLAQHVECGNRHHLDMRIRMPLHVFAQTIAVLHREKRRHQNQIRLSVFKAGDRVVNGIHQRNVGHDVLADECHQQGSSLLIGFDRQNL